MDSFNLRLPGNILFGEGKLNLLGETACKYGNSAIVFLSMRLASASDIINQINDELDRYKIRHLIVHVECALTGECVSELTGMANAFKPQCIIAIGESCVIDCAKAVRCLMANGWTVSELIEKANTRLRFNTALPLLTLPTTAGSGTAVSDEMMMTSYQGDMFLAPLKNEIFMPAATIIDPLLMQYNTPEMLLYSGFDAFCQLLEAYVSNGSNIFTDTLMLKGFKLMASDFRYLLDKGTDCMQIRKNISYAAFLSGIGVTNSELTLIHGLAFSIGRLYSAIPHGAICASILFACTLVNMQRVQMFDPMSEATKKYAKIGSVLSGIEDSIDKHSVLLRAVTENLKNFTKELNVPTLSALGIDKEDFYEIVSNTRLYGNPVDLAETEIMEILEMSY